MTPRERLLRVGLEQGQPVPVIVTLLQAVGATEDVIDLPRIAAGYTQILRAAQNGKPLTITQADQAQIQEICDWIMRLSHDPAACKRIGESFFLGNPAPAKNPCLGNGVRTHASLAFPYAVLWQAPRDTKNARSFYRLIAQMYELRKTDHIGKVYVNRCYKASVALRELANQSDWQIPEELKIWESSENFQEGCGRFYRSKVKNLYRRAFIDICLWVLFPTKELRKGSSERRGSYGTRNHQILETNTHLLPENPRGYELADVDDPDQPSGYYQVESERLEPDSQEISLDELCAAIELLLLDDGSSARPYFMDRLRAQAILDHIIKSRQFHAFSYLQLTLKELSSLLFGVGDLFGNLLEARATGEQSPALQLQMEALLALHLSLWLGQPINLIAEMVIDSSESDWSSPLVFIPEGKGHFAMVVTRPDLSGDNGDQPEAGIKKDSLHLLVPDLAGSASLIKHLNPAPQLIGGKVFSHTSIELETEARRVLSLLGKGDTRYTLGKLRGFVFLQIVIATQNVAVASMLSGVPELSARVPRYYMQIDGDFLCQTYVEVLAGLLTQIYACAGLEYVAPTVQLSQRGAVGATHCLEPATVSSNVKALTAILGKKPKGGIGELVLWHNCFALWTLEMFWLVTGCRAIRNPLQSLAHFDPVTWMSAMSDKDSADRHMSRLICLPTMVANQLENFYAHCAELNRQLTGYLEPDPAHRWKEGFFLAHDGERYVRIEIRPASVKEQMRKLPGYLPHRVNAFRKYMCTTLTEQGCPAEVIASFMGHWLRGEEPQDAYSSFEPMEYQKQLDKWVTPALEQLGWFIRKGVYA